MFNEGRRIILELNFESVKNPNPKIDSTIYLPAVISYFSTGKSAGRVETLKNVKKR
jgi:hypothetical protein